MERLIVTWVVTLGLLSAIISHAFLLPVPPLPTTTHLPTGEARSRNSPSLARPTPPHQNFTSNQACICLYNTSCLALWMMTPGVASWGRVIASSSSSSSYKNTRHFSSMDGVDDDDDNEEVVPGKMKVSELKVGDRAGWLAGPRRGGDCEASRSWPSGLPVSPASHRLRLCPSIRQLAMASDIWTLLC